MAQPQNPFLLGQAPFGLVANPQYQAKTKGEALLQSLDPSYWIGRGGQAIGSAIQAIPEWWASPTTAATPTPQVDDQALFSNYLQGLLGPGGQSGMTFTAPGTAPVAGSALPKPPRVEAPDFSEALSTLEGAAPGAVTELPQAAALPARQVPGALTSEEQQAMISRGRWGGAAEALLGLSSDADIGDILLAAGAGSLAGRQRAEERATTMERERTEKQFEFDVRREEAAAAAEQDRQRYNLDRQDRQQVAMHQHQLALAGLQTDQAKAVADTALQNTKMQYEYALAQARASIDAAQAMQPKVQLLGDKGVAIISRGPDGRQQVQIKPLDLEGMSGLGGLGTAGDLAELQASGGDPAVIANMMIRHADRRGMLQSVFGEALQDIESEVSSRMPADFRTMGEEGRKMWQTRFRAERDWALTEGVMQSPNLRAKLFESLTNRAAPTR